jgi:hypothetical protein
VQRGEDQICWILSKKKLFEVKSYYHVLFTPVRSPFHWKSIWKVKISSRGVFFVWTMALEKILTLNNLRKMNIYFFLISKTNCDKRKMNVVEWCCV